MPQYVYKPHLFDELQIQQLVRLILSFLNVLWSKQWRILDIVTRYNFQHPPLPAYHDSIKYHNFNAV